MAETLTFPDHLLGDTPETFQPLQLNKTPRVLKVVFGDGYQQRAQDGINHNPQRWRVTFNKRSGTDVEGVYDFLEARGGVDYFLWTPRGEDSARKFICPSYTRTYDHKDVVQGITFEIEEVFEA